MTVFDPATVWDALPAEVQRRFALAAVIGVAAHVREVELGLLHQPSAAWSTAFGEAWNTMRAIVDPDRPELADLKAPELKAPDLAAIGLRSCEICGCSDRYGCPGGCSWVGPRLCSGCSPRGAA